MNEKKLIKYIEIILGAAAIYSSILFLLKIYSFDIYNFLITLNPLLTVIASLILVVITYQYVIETKLIAESNQKNLANTEKNSNILEKTMKYQALAQVQKDYRSAEMMVAIDALWNFYRKCVEEGQDIKNEFKIQVEIDKSKRLKIENTLNYKRRLLTHFYVHLGSIHANEILPDYMIFDWWDENDFDMIEKFIIPLQEAAAEIHGLTAKTNEALQNLRKLKEDCRIYTEKKKKQNI